MRKNVLFLFFSVTLFVNCVQAMEIFSDDDDSEEMILEQMRLKVDRINNLIKTVASITSDLKIANQELLEAESRIEIIENQIKALTDNFDGYPRDDYSDEFELSLEDFQDEQFSSFKKCCVKVCEFLTSNGVKNTIIIVSVAGVVIGYLICDDYNGLLVSRLLGENLSWALTPAYWMGATLLAGYESIVASLKGYAIDNSSTILEQLVEQGAQEVIIEVVEEFVEENMTDITIDGVVANSQDCFSLCAIIKLISQNYHSALVSGSCLLSKLTLGRVGGCSIL